MTEGTFEQTQSDARSARLLVKATRRAQLRDAPMAGGFSIAVISRGEVLEALEGDLEAARSWLGVAGKWVEARRQNGQQGYIETQYLIAVSSESGRQDRDGRTARAVVVDGLMTLVVASAILTVGFLIAAILLGSLVTGGWLDAEGVAPAMDFLVNGSLILLASMGASLVLVDRWTPGGHWLTRFRLWLYSPSQGYQEFSPRERAKRYRGWAVYLVALTGLSLVIGLLARNLLLEQPSRIAPGFERHVRLVVWASVVLMVSLSILNVYLWLKALDLERDGGHWLTGWGRWRQERRRQLARRKEERERQEREAQIRRQQEAQQVKAITGFEPFAMLGRHGSLGVIGWSDTSGAFINRYRQVGEMVDMWGDLIQGHASDLQAFWQAYTAARDRLKASGITTRWRGLQTLGLVAPLRWMEFNQFRGVTVTTYIAQQGDDLYVSWRAFVQGETAQWRVWLSWLLLLVVWGLGVGAWGFGGFGFYFDDRFWARLGFYPVTWHLLWLGVGAFLAFGLPGFWGLLWRQGDFGAFWRRRFHEIYLDEVIALTKVIHYSILEAAEKIGVDRETLAPRTPFFRHQQRPII